MPTKFRKSVKILVDRVSKKYKVVNYYIKNTSTEELQAELASTARPKNKNKCRNELIRRGVL